MALKKIIVHGERMPTGYGLTWYRGYTDNVAVCMPVPLNVLARLARDLWLYLAYPGEIAVNPRAAYQQGREDATDEIHQAEDERAAQRTAERYQQQQAKAAPRNRKCN